MVNISTFGDSAIKFTFTGSDHYLYGNGEITVPVNSLSLVIDESDMACFKKGDGDTFIAFNIADSNFASKDALVAFYKDNMVSEGGVPEEEIQAMIASATSGYADSVTFNSENNYIEFYHDDTKVYELDASDFVIDGMIDDVRIETIGGVSYLVIDFNTASGKQDIQIPLTDIFNPDNYYTKTDIDNKLGSGFTSSSVTEVIESNERVVANAINSLNAEVSGKTDTSAFTAHTADTTIHLTSGDVENQIDAAISGKADTTAVTQEISAAVSGKVDTDTYTAYTAATDAALSGKQDTLSAGTNITISGNVISADVDIKGIEGGRGITVTTGTSADTVAFNIPIYQGKGDYSLSLTQQSGTTTNTFNNVVSGFSSTAIGAGLTVTNQYETGLGVFNANRPQSQGQPFGNSGHTLLTVGNGGGTASTQKHNALEIRQNGDIYYADTNDTAHTDYYTKPMVKLQDVIDGKQDTLSAGTNITISGNVISAEGGGKAIEGGRGITVTTGTSADTVSFNLPISADSNTYINAGVGNTNNNTALNILIGSGNTAYNGNAGTISGGTAIGFGNEVGYIGRETFGSKSYSFAFGYGNKIQGGHCYAIGENNNIGKGTGNSKDKSFLIGYYNTCTLNGDSSGNYIFGNYCTVSKSDEFALGKYNSSSNGSTDADRTYFSIGNGTANNARHNAFEIRQNGDIYISKDGTDIKLQDALGGEVSSAITSGDTNPVQGGVLYDELRVPSANVTTLEWDNHDGAETLNYTSGTTKLEFIVDESQMTDGYFTLVSDTQQDYLGYIYISSTGGNITVTASAVTYTISGNVVTATYPSIAQDITSINSSYDCYWTVNAYGEEIMVPLKDKVTALDGINERLSEDEEVTAAALNLLNDKVAEDEEVTAAALNTLSENFDGLKLKKLTQAQYSAMEQAGTLDNSTLYIVIDS